MLRSRSTAALFERPTRPAYPPHFSSGVYSRVVYKNIARELTTRLRRMNTALESKVETWETAMFRRGD